MPKNPEFDPDIDDDNERAAQAIKERHDRLRIALKRLYGPFDWKSCRTPMTTGDRHRVMSHFLFELRSLRSLWQEHLVLLKRQKVASPTALRKLSAQPRYGALCRFYCRPRTGRGLDPSLRRRRAALASAIKRHEAQLRQLHSDLESLSVVFHACGLDPLKVYGLRDDWTTTRLDDAIDALRWYRRFGSRRNPELQYPYLHFKGKRIHVPGVKLFKLLEFLWNEQAVHIHDLVRGRNAIFPTEGALATRLNALNKRLSPIGVAYSREKGLVVQTTG